MSDIFAGMPQYWWAFVLLGIVVGAVGGLLGLGGGVILIPALIVLLGFSQKSAQGMSLAFVVPIALIGAFRYKTALATEFDTGKFCLLAIGGIVGVLAGTALMARIPEAVLRRVFAGVLLIFALRMLFSAPTPTTGQDAIRRNVRMQPATADGDQPVPQENKGDAE